MSGIKPVFDVDRPSLSGEDKEVRRFYESELAQYLVKKGLSADSRMNLDRVERERIRQLMQRDSPKDSLN
jgi:hypothetical protein